MATESKSASAFRTISEVATNLEVPQHVLRFWESKFQQVRPLKRGGGRRYYRPEDVTLLSNIKELLYNQGLTIRGVQKLLKETGRGGIVRPSALATAAADSVGAASAHSTTQNSHAVSASVASSDMSRSMANLTSVTQAAPEVAAIVAKPEAQILTMAARREMEGLLSELRTMREMLRQTGV